jgi:hypothetical protein
MALNYATPDTPACTSFNSLASSTTTGAAECAAITVSTTNNVTDYMLRVKVTVGAITPSASTNVILYLVGSDDGINWAGGAATTEVFDGTDKAITLSATSNNMRFAGTINCPTASIAYNSEPISVASIFGGILPKKFVVVIQNQTGQALASSGNAVAATAIYYN